MRELPQCFLLVLVFLILVNFSFSQEVRIEYPYKQYTVHDGLVQMQVQALYQDSKGYLWCGTKSGISRFDGENFMNYSSLDLKQSSPVSFFSEDDDGNLIVFNHNNISVLKGDTAQFFPYPQNYQTHEFDARPHANHNTKMGKVLLQSGSYRNYLLNFNKLDSLFVTGFDKNLGSNICFDNSNPDLIWQIRHDSIFSVQISSQKAIKGYRANRVQQVVKNKSGTFAFSRSQGIFQLIGDTFIQVDKTQFSNDLLDVISTPDSTSFIISCQKDIYHFRNNRLIPIKKDMTLIRDILFDHEGNLWVATEEGLYNFFRLHFENYTFGMGNKDWVWSMVEDMEKNMWFTSYQNGIWKFDRSDKVVDYTQKVEDFKAKEKVHPYPFHYFMGASSHKNMLYFPTNSNIVTYDGTKFDMVREIPMRWNSAFFFSKTSKENIFYAGGMSGLYKVIPDQEVRHWNKEELDISTIMTAEVDSNKITVIGSNGIVEIRNDTIYKRISQSEIEKNYCSITDHKGNIWVGSNQKLKLIVGSSISEVVTNTKELYFSLLFVEPYYLLIGGLNGLSVVNLNDYYTNNIFEPTLYNHNNGFTGTECGQNGFLTDSEGYVWINTSDLVTRFNPQTIIEEETKAPYLYLETEVSDNNIDWHFTENDTAKKRYAYRNNNFRFRLNAISFCNAKNIRYSYKLDGLQENWSPPAKNDEISFYNLKPGEYTFYGMADPGTCKAQSVIVSMSFKIEKPYWLSWWFILLSVVVFIVLVGAVVYILNKKVRREELVKKRILQLRADALKAQMNPHLIYNALNNINGLINLGQKHEAQNYLTAFSDLLRLVFESTNKQEINLQNELEIIKSYIHFHKQAQNKDFDFKLSSGLSIDPYNILIPPVLIQPYVENAILHGFSGIKHKGLIHIHTKNSNNRLILTIEDNGVGMGSSLYKGNGRGTHLTRQRMQLLEKKSENQVNIVNLKQGTRVEINIPLKLLK